MPAPDHLLCLISYDIPSDEEGTRRRTRLAKLLLSIGLRIHFSVFEAEISSGSLHSLIDDISAIIDSSKDSIRIYTICARCRQQTISLGPQKHLEYSSVLIW